MGLFKLAATYGVVRSGTKAGVRSANKPSSGLGCGGLLLVFIIIGAMATNGWALLGGVLVIVVGLGVIVYQRQGATELASVVAPTCCFCEAPVSATAVKCKSCGEWVTDPDAASAG